MMEEDTKIATSLYFQLTASPNSCPAFLFPRPRLLYREKMDRKGSNTIFGELCFCFAIVWYHKGVLRLFLNYFFAFRGRQEKIGSFIR